MQTEDLKIVALMQENILGIKIAEITPEGDFIRVGGENSSGKSSLLNGLELALCGVRKGQPSPLRNGEKRGRTFVDLDKYRIERIFSDTNPTGRLVVKSKDGAVYSSPQKLLNDIFADIAFDPQEFSRLKDAEQAEQLRQMVGVDFADLDAKHDEAYAERTAINRDLKAVKGKLAGGDFYDAPETEVSVAELAEELERRTAVNEQNDALRDRLEEMDRHIGVGREKLAGIEEQIRKLQEQAEGIKQKLSTLGHDRLIVAEQVEQLKDENIDEITQQIKDSQEINAKVRANRERDALLNQQADLENAAAELTAAIDSVKAERAARLKAAKFPIAGLSFADDGRVIYNGVYLSQCSTTEKIRVSTAVAIAMAKDKPLKILFVRDGTLMLPESLAMVAKMAHDAGFTTYIEWASNDKEGCQVWIEDGVASQVEAGEEVGVNG